MTTYSPGLGASGSGAPVIIEDASGNRATVTDGNLNVDSATLNLLIETLQELTSRLTAIASTVANTAQLRVVQTTVPTTAVTLTSTSLTNFGTGVPGREVADDINNTTAILGNINNTTI